MIKEIKVLTKINLRNSSYYKKLGYDVSEKEIYVDVKHLTTNSKVRVTAICEICTSENELTFGKYNVNINRNDKGYYSCFKCKNIEKEKTCIDKYGVKSYSMTDEFKVSESIKWKGIQKGSKKGKVTMLEKYGVDSYFKTDIMKEKNREWMSSDSFKEKSKKTMINKYGVDSYSKTDNFKEDISSKKDLIVLKIKESFLKKYGVDSPSKLNEVKLRNFLRKDEIQSIKRKTCLEKYGVDNVSKLKDIQDKIKKTKIENGVNIPDELITDWELYKKDVRKITNRNKKVLYENWDWLDYYDNELIKSYLSYSHVHKFYPTIDHKLSVFFGFANDISAEEIGHLDNLCITKRYLNSIKNKMVESEFLEKLNDIKS